MDIFQIFSAIVVLFVMIQLLLVIYNHFVRSNREGMETLKKNPQWCEMDKNLLESTPDLCNTTIKMKPYSGMQLKDVCTDICGTSDDKSSQVPIENSVASSLADGARSTDEIDDNTLDKDDTNSYSQGVKHMPEKMDVLKKCDVLKIHFEKGHKHPHGKWFPKNIDKLNLNKTLYEEAGRRFMHDESIRKGLQIPKMLDSEAEVLGRMVWRTYLDSLMQVCDENSESSVQRTMDAELKLMNKVHKIQEGSANSSLVSNSGSVAQKTQPKQSDCNRTTGMMTTTTSDNRPGALLDENKRGYPLYNSYSNAKYSGYYNDYKPRDPSKKPQAYNSIWDLF